MIDKLAGWLMVAILVGLLAGCASVEQAHEVVALEADKQAEPVLSELPADLADADGASGGRWHFGRARWQVAWGCHFADVSECQT